MTDLTKLAIDLEHYVTPRWAADAILEKELMPAWVLDPCTGTGILAQAAEDKGYDVIAQDIHDWGYPMEVIEDYLQNKTYNLESMGVFMNPPFSLACEFVEKSFALNARKIVCFQRFAWRESAIRKGFWDKYPPNRVYICADRADCWRHDLPVDEKGRRRDPVTGKVMNGTTTAHAWFVWERGHPPGTMMGAISKAD